MTGPVERPRWQVSAPPGGWPSPWPQVVELVRVIPHEKWTLIGGLMVQLHAAHAGMLLTRPTVDVDMVLHIETGAATWSGVREQLEGLGYLIPEPVGERHLDDAAVLACTVDNPIRHRSRMAGSDRARIQHLGTALEDPTHPAWIAPGEQWARRGRAARAVLAANPDH